MVRIREDHRHKYRRKGRVPLWKVLEPSEMDTSDEIRQHVGEMVTVDREGHEIVIHDADEAKLAALGKKRTRCYFLNLIFRGDGQKFQYPLDARDVFLYYCDGMSPQVNLT